MAKPNIASAPLRAPTPPRTCVTEQPPPSSDVDFVAAAPLEPALLPAAPAEPLAAPPAELPPGGFVGAPAAATVLAVLVSPPALAPPSFD